MTCYGSNETRLNINAINLWLKRHCYLSRCVWPKVLLFSCNPRLSYHLFWHLTFTWWHPPKCNKAFIKVKRGLSYEGPGILSPKTGYKGMTQHPAPAGILYGLNCPPIGGERGALLLVNLSGSCYWVEFDATNEAVKIPFSTILFHDHCCVE